MQSHEIISGFSDIKSELRTRTGRTNLTIRGLRLWFSLVGGVLYAHDYKNHNDCIAMAIKSNANWKIRLDQRTFGYKLIFETTRNVPERKIVDYLKALYEKYGYY